MVIQSNVLKFKVLNLIFFGYRPLWMLCIGCIFLIYSDNFHKISGYGTKYSRMDQLKFVEDLLKQTMSFQIF